MSIGRWVSKTQSVHTVECRSTLAKKDTLTPATTWVNLEGTVLSEMNQSQKDRSRLTPPLGAPPKETETGWWGQGLGRGWE